MVQIVNRQQQYSSQFVLTTAYLNTMWNVEFLQCTILYILLVMLFFFFIFKHSQAPKRSWKCFMGVLESPGKVLDFLVSKRVGLGTLASPLPLRCLTRPNVEAVPRQT